MEKLLIIMPWVPYPLDSGGRQGAFHMLNYIKDYYDIHLWFHLARCQENSGLLQELDKALLGKVHIHYSKNKAGLNSATVRTLVKRMANRFLKNDVQYQHAMLLGGMFESSYADYDALFEIESLIYEYNIHKVQIEFFGMMDFVFALPDFVKKIFIHHELGFARNETLLGQVEKKCVFDRYRINRHKQIEISTLNAYDCVITMSDVDKVKLIEEGVKTKIESSPLFIPKEHKEYPVFVPTKNRLTYIAYGKHYPNMEGLEWFVKNVHPILSKTLNYKLDIIGKGWDNLNFEIPSNINFLGYVKDLTTVIPGSIMIVPILSGSGMRMKILESVNNSVPFVSTTVGAEGLLFSDGNDCFIEDDIQQYAEKIIRLLNNEKLQEQFVLTARNVYEDNYSAKSLAERRLKILNSIN